MMVPPYSSFHFHTRCDERVAAQGLAGRALGGELPLDHHLGGDAGVVRARAARGR